MKYELVKNLPFAIAGDEVVIRDVTRYSDMPTFLIEVINKEGKHFKLTTGTKYTKAKEKLAELISEGWVKEATE